MKTLKHISKAIEVLNSLNKSTKMNSVAQANLELTNTRFVVNLKKTSAQEKAPNPLLTLMYSEENETLFI